MLRVGLTGGIGCGKTTVARMMRDLGCHVLEADRFAHRLMAPGQPAYEEIIGAFGREICGPGGHIDRAKLAQIVFAEAEMRERLNRIVHPRVVAQIERELAELERTRPDSVAVVEAALLVESGYYERMNRLVVVWCTPEQQIERLVDPQQGRGMTRETAERRIAAQMPLEEKLRLADDVINCSGSLAEIRVQVEGLVGKFKQLATR